VSTHRRERQPPDGERNEVQRQAEEPLHVNQLRPAILSHEQRAQPEITANCVLYVHNAHLFSALKYNASQSVRFALKFENLVETKPKL